MVKAKYHVIHLAPGQACPPGYSDRSTRRGVICTKKLTEEEVRAAAAAGVPAVAPHTTAPDPVDSLAGLFGGMGFGSTPAAPAAAAATPATPVVATPAVADPMNALMHGMSFMKLGVIIEQEEPKQGGRRRRSTNRLRKAKKTSQKKNKKTRRH